MVRAELNNTDYMLTVGHPFEACSTGLGNNTDVSQSYQEFGEVAGDYPKLDVAHVEITDSGFSYNGNVNMETTAYNVAGVASESEVEYYMNSDTPVKKMGRSTGKTTGTIDSMNEGNGFDCLNYGNEGVVVTADQAQGDSGGPAMITFSNGDCSILNINGTGYRQKGTTRNGAILYEGGGGTAGYHIEDQGYIIG